MNDCAIILLGATGDLARRKIFPALYQLFLQNKLSYSIIISAALEEISAAELLEKTKSSVNPRDAQSWQEFGTRIFYKQMNFTKEADFAALEKFVIEQEHTAGLTGNRLVYCATAPYFYCAITQGLAASGMVKRMAPRYDARASTQDAYQDLHMVSSSRSEHIEPRTTPWHRIVYEKPFGHNLESAHEINACIAAHFDEKQIFRIDHYLTKELVGNIALVRFTNIIFEPLWNNRYIDQVQIILDESLGVEGRGAFYDKYGALGDVVQNHMMQLLALIAMESPPKLTGDLIRSQRANVLQKVTVIDAVVGQYTGYAQEAGIPDSKTETFAQVKLQIENPRWAGVPFYIRTGKCLEKKETLIYIQFKHVDCLLSKACPSEPNHLVIKISPHPLFSLTLNAKKPGRSDEVMPVQMHFSHGTFAEEGPQAYERLFEEILKGEQSVSVRFDEIEYAWKIIDAVRALHPPLVKYEKGSMGPAEAKKLFDGKHGVRWKI